MNMVENNNSCENVGKQEIFLLLPHFFEKSGESADLLPFTEDF